MGLLSLFGPMGATAVTDPHDLPPPETAPWSAARIDIGRRMGLRARRRWTVRLAIAVVALGLNHRKSPWVVKNHQQLEATTA